VKEFKSLEGFFESGPQFILQGYILLRGELPHFEKIDSITGGELNPAGFRKSGISCEVGCFLDGIFLTTLFHQIIMRLEMLKYFIFSDRALIMSASITLSFLSLTKTGFNLNSPDPDEKRREQQFKEKSKLFINNFQFAKFIFYLINLTIHAKR